MIRDCFRYALVLCFVSGCAALKTPALESQDARDQKVLKQSPGKQKGQGVTHMLKFRDKGRAEAFLAWAFRAGYRAELLESRKALVEVMFEDGAAVERQTEALSYAAKEFVGKHIGWEPNG